MLSKLRGHDLNLIKALLNYSDINPAASAATAEKLKRHLWYLSEESISLALFNEEGSLEIKSGIVISMKHQEENNDEKNQERCNQDLESRPSSRD